MTRSEWASTFSKGAAFGHVPPLIALWLTGSRLLAGMLTLLAAAWAIQGWLVQ